MEIIVTLGDVVEIVMLAVMFLVLVVYFLIILISAKCGKIFEKKSEKSGKDREEGVDE